MASKAAGALRMHRWRQRACVVTSLTNRSHACDCHLQEIAALATEGVTVVAMIEEHFMVTDIVHSGRQAGGGAAA